MTKTLPQTRSKDIVVQNLDGETLIYDVSINKAYCLNKTAAIVYNACNESKTFAELTRKHKLTEDVIYFALDELREQNLLESPQYISSLAGMNRREAIRKVGLGSMLALPVITTLLAPKSAAAASCRTQTCTFFEYRQSDCCNGSRCSLGGNCQDCLASGAIFATEGIVGCDADLEKNRCCDTSGTAVTDGTNCRCP